MFPRSSIGRILAGLWLAACLAVLVDGFIERNIPESDITFAILILFLTFPAGWVFAGIISVLFKFLYDSYGITAPGGFWPNLILWPFFGRLVIHSGSF